jgi:hypothetical protein
VSSIANWIFEIPLLLLDRQVLERAHVVQPVGQLDEDHPQVAGHGEHHLAQVLGLGLGLGGELQLADLGDALDQVRHVLAEAGLEVEAGGAGVLDHVVQQGRADGVGVEALGDQDGGHAHGMGDVGLARGALLLLVALGPVLEGPHDLRLVDALRRARHDLAELLEREGPGEQVPLVEGALRLDLGCRLLHALPRALPCGAVSPA